MADTSKQADRLDDAELSQKLREIFAGMLELASWQTRLICEATEAISRWGGDGPATTAPKRAPGARAPRATAATVKAAKTTRLRRKKGT